MVTYTQSRGAKTFHDFLKSRGVSDATAAEALGVKAVTVYHWRIGAKVPEYLNRRKIEKYTREVDTATSAVVKLGIASELWDEDKERAEIDAVETCVLRPQSEPTAPTAA